MQQSRKVFIMRIAYLTQVHPSPDRTDIDLPPQTTEALAKRGHHVLVIAASDREYTYHIYRNKITIVQLRSFKCPLYIGQQPVFLPFPTILQTLYRFQPDIVYMDMASSVNWIGYLYSFFFHIPTKSTPQGQIKVAE
jgi:hypothetical protein